jgi:fumarate reductase flavoprotein subunit
VQRGFPSVYGSAGRIKINEKAEVIGQDRKPIKGLYATGTDACSIYGDSYPSIFPGTSMGVCYQYWTYSSGIYL